MTDDLIGRAEAQTAIQFAAKRYTVAHEAHGEGQIVWSDNLINVTDAMNALRDLPSAQPEQRWIPVSERLPDEDGLYIVTTSKGTVQFHTFNHNGNSEEYWIRCNKAWMPLPEPYQEGEQE